MRASVLLPTKDRGPAIEATIRSLLDQEFPADEYEIVVVDNRSTAENQTQLQGFAREFPDRIRYLREEKLGLNNARNCGIHGSTGDIVVFLDDDAVPQRHWLTNIVRAFDADPEVYALGSKIIARFTTAAPDWIDARLDLFLSSFDRGEEIEQLHYNDYPRGANMAFRRQAFVECGEFLDCFDRKGDSLMSYGEIEICYRIDRAGHKVIYIPDAEVDHMIRGDRLTPGWFDRRFYWQGRSEGLFERMHFGILRVLRKLPCHVVFSFFGGDRFSRQRHRGFVGAAAGNLFRTRFA